METIKLSDEALIRQLRQHPQIRERVASLLAAVNGESGQLRLADDAEMRVTQELRRMGTDAMQAWAQGQVNLTEQEIRRTGVAHREGKKNCAGTPPLATSA